MATKALEKHITICQDKVGKYMRKPPAAAKDRNEKFKALYERSQIKFKKQIGSMTQRSSTNPRGLITTPKRPNKYSAKHTKRVSDIDLSDIMNKGLFKEEVQPAASAPKVLLTPVKKLNKPAKTLSKRDLSIKSSDNQLTPRQTYNVRGPTGIPTLRKTQTTVAKNVSRPAPSISGRSLRQVRPGESRKPKTKILTPREGEISSQNVTDEDESEDEHNVDTPGRESDSKKMHAKINVNETSSKK